jgi:hypothetical protein
VVEQTSSLEVEGSDAALDNACGLMPLLTGS